MAINGQVKTNSEYDSYFWVKWEQVGTQDITNNKTLIKWSCGLYTTHLFYSNAIKMSAFSINGTKVYSGGTYSNFTARGEQTIASGTLNIAHKADGTQTISISSFTGWLYSNHNYSSSGGSWALDTIPRASSFGTITGNTIGGSVTVNISRAVSSFTHQLWYKVGKSAWYDLGTNIETSKTFTIDIETAKQFPNSVSGTMQLCLRTFNGTTQIGSDVYKDVTVYVPDYTIRIDNISLTGNGLCNGAYVQGKSTVTVKITASTSYGATIQAYLSIVDSKLYNGQSFTTSALSSGTKNIFVSISDSRGKYAEAYNPEPLVVYPYAIPVISEFLLERQSDGTTVLAHLKGEVAPVGNSNTKSFSVTLNDVTQSVSTDEYTVDTTLTFTDVPTDSTLIATAKIADYYTSVSKDVTLPTVAVTMDFHHSGTGIAMGKVAEHEKMFEIASEWDAKYKGVVVQDFIVEQGTNGIWTYRKWDSGIAECWGVQPVSNIVINQKWEFVYYADPPGAIAYPFTFTDVPMETAIMHCNDAWTWMGAATGNTAAYTARYYLMRPFPGESSLTVHIHRCVKGRWK